MDKQLIEQGGERLMPCGGIAPIKNSVVREVPNVLDGGTCWQCGKSGALHFVEEWDDFIHARCVPLFLQTEEGRVIIRHGHEVYLDFSLEAVNG